MIDCPAQAVLACRAGMVVEKKKGSRWFWAGGDGFGIPVSFSWSVLAVQCAAEPMQRAMPIRTSRALELRTGPSGGANASVKCQEETRNNSQKQGDWN